MGNGMILDSPTIFGMSGNSLLAGGRCGSRRRRFVPAGHDPECRSKQTGTTGKRALSAALENVGGGGDITIPVYLGGAFLMKSWLTRRQGRTCGQEADNMAYIQYLNFDGTDIPLPDSFDVEVTDVVSDTGGETEAGTTQRDVIRSGVEYPGFVFPFLRHG